MSESCVNELRIINGVYLEMIWNENEKFPVLCICNLV